MVDKLVFVPLTSEEMLSIKGKFYFNENGKTLHEIGKCHHTKQLFRHQKIFSSIDEAIASETRYFSYCKICFKE